ncbi:RES domain-containing protein [Sphingomonas faeni]|uniref:RES domain-containing protein n=1 Tax=Sphingomonas faeni TaxID=185950 RepID=UPI002788C7EE|nr:RES domain-containing protein [Sphingomonas faeni]MDQ0840299.1 hypothetical protein [Sphingomonas faeni]
MPDHVCKDCVGDPIVSAEIAAGGSRHMCMVCNRRRTKTFSLEALADRIDPIYLNLVGIADEDVRIRNGEVTFGPVGDHPSQILINMLQVDDDIVGQRLAAILSQRHDFNFQEGEIDVYDETSDDFAIREPTGSDLHESWDRFCDQLKHRRRFFLQEGKKVLDELLGPIVRGEWPPNGVIRTIGPNSDITHVFRGRKANDEAQQKTIFGNRLKQLAAPEPGLAGAGRMNAAGIGLFYGALDQDTCVAELRTPVGGGAIVGRFEIVRPLRVLDLTMLDLAYEDLSYFSQNYIQRRSYGGFMRGFHQEVRRAVIPGRENLDYLPTQVVAEYLWSEADPVLDGIIFESAQISNGRNNLVLFPHASLVEGVEQEAKRGIEFVSYSSLRDPEDEDEEPEDHVFFKQLPEQADPAAPGMAKNDDDFFAAILGAAHRPAPALETALRLGPQGVLRITVNSIQYDNKSTPVRFSDWTEPGF